MILSDFVLIRLFLIHLFGTMGGRGVGEICVHFLHLASQESFWSYLFKLSREDRIGGGGRKEGAEEVDVEGR